MYGTTVNAGSDGFGTVFQIILPPTILSPPTNQTVLEGGNATFTVSATGFGPLIYQWQRNGGNISGATNTTLSLSNLTVASAGNYSVQVLNVGGTSVASATLIVGCPTIALAPATLPVAQIGRAYSQTISAIGGVAPYSFGLTRGGAPSGLTLSTSGVLSGTPTHMGNYRFTVRTTDLDGCIATNLYSLAVSNYLLFNNLYLDTNGWFHARLNAPAGSNFVIVASTNLALK